MGKHATFAPSKAHQWIPCPGSIALTRDIPRESSPYADEGTAAHHFGQCALSYEKDVSFWIGQPVQIGDREWRCTEEMASFVQDYVDDVRRRAAGGQLLVERKLDFSETIGIPEQFGTGDAVILSADGRRLTSEDLKYGLGVKVYAKDNYQGLIYLVAALETYAPILGDVEEFEFVVHQPRLDHVDSHVYTRAELEEFIEKMKLAGKYGMEGLRTLEIDGMQALLQQSELFSPGDEQCRFCPALGTCPFAARKVAEEVYADILALEKQDELLIRPAPPVPSGDSLGAAYGQIDFIEGWCRAVRAECERMVLAGMTVIGPDGLAMKVIEGKKGNRFWWDEEAAEAALVGLLPPEKAFKPREIVSVAQAEKALGKKRKADFETALLPYVRQKDGALKVVQGSHPAPAYSGEASASEFETITANEET